MRRPMIAVVLAASVATHVQADPQLLGLRFGEELTELDPATGQVISRIDLQPPGSFMDGMGYDRIRNRVLTIEWLNNDGLVQIDALDITTGERTKVASYAGAQAGALTHNALTDQIIVANNYPGGVGLDPHLEFFDAQGNRRTVELEVGRVSLRGLAAHPASGRLIAVTLELPRLWRIQEIDPDSGVVTDLAYSIPNRLFGSLTFDPTGRYLYLATVSLSHGILSRIEFGRTDSFTDISPIEDGYHALTFTPSPPTFAPLLAWLVMARRRR